MFRRTITVLALLALAGLASSGCVVRTVHVVETGPPVEYEYQPLLYDGYVVYYTQAGVPFYWVSGARVFLPLEYRAHYVSHWHSHRAAYRSWHKHRGRHYKSRRYKVRKRPVKHPLRPARVKHRHTVRPVKKPKHTLQPKRGARPVLQPKKKEKKEKKKTILKPER